MYRPITFSLGCMDI